jgi:PmbA protein
MTTVSHEELASRLLEKAKSNGATAGDVVVVESESSEVQVRMKEIETLSNAREKRLGIRLFMGRRAAVSSTADFTPSSLDDLVSNTCDLARATSEDPHAGLPESDSPAGNPHSGEGMNLVDPDMMKLPMESRIEMAQKAESTALQEDERITNSEGSGLNLYTRRVTYANSNGFSGNYRTSSVSLSVMPIASTDGSMQRDYWYCAKRLLSLMETPESIGRTAARRTVRRLGSRKVRTMACPVVFDPETAGELLGSLSSAVSGYSIYKGASFLVGKLGVPIASKGVTVIDDGTIPSGLGSRPFDGEGLATRKTMVIREGVLESYLLDTYSGRKLGMASTGNAVRSLGDFPTVSPTNFYMAPGNDKPEDIIGSVKNGLYVTELIGFGVNLVTGDYSRGASGLWIENGEFAFPVEGITIAGNLMEMLKQIEMVGTDLDFRGTVAAPTLRISQMMVAGD